jgi:hypothetical protein
MSDFKDNTNKEFSKIRLALEEHLSAINENSSEIQALFDYLQQLDNKIEKLSQRLDGVQMENSEPHDEFPSIVPLNQTEKKVFLTLYTEQLPLSHQEISSRARVPLSIVTECLSSLAEKCVPILRTMANGQIFVKLSPSFKERQAKENLVNLSLESFM